MFATIFLPHVVMQNIQARSENNIWKCMW